MVDQDRRVAQRVDEVGVMRDDPVDAAIGDGLRLSADGDDGRWFAGPTRCQRHEAGGIEELTHGVQELACSQRPCTKTTGICSDR